MAVKQDIVWEFDVTDPQMHPKGFTVYRVVCKWFSVRSPESLTELILWKRYNDFKQLFKAVFALHRTLHRQDAFPYFAKPKMFGRFDDDVIEERRKSAANLLNFIGLQLHLYKSQAFQAFLKSGCIDQREIRRTVGAEVLKPSKIDLLDTPNQGDGYPPPDVVMATVDPAPAGQEQSATGDSGGAADTSQSLSAADMVSSHALEGTWKFPQIPDNISLGSSTEAEDTEDTDPDSSLGTPLPDTDMSFFDPLTPDKAGQSESSSKSMKWLEDALNTCASIGDKEGEVKGEEQEQSTEGGDLALQQAEDQDGSEGSAPEVAGTSPQEGENGVISQGTSDQTFDIAEFDPLRERSGSKVECGKGDADFDLSGSYSLSSRGPSLSSVSSSAPSTPKSKATTPKSLSPVNRPGRSGTNVSVSTMDLGGKEDYIYKAANQICLAQEFEANGNYEQAFNCYKSGVGVLLQGVQDDSNRGRRDAVRKKTAQYLMKAEALYHRYLSNDSTILDERRWAADTLISPCLELDPSFAFIKGAVTDLRNFKVLGTIGKVLLVMDRQTDETFVIKTIYKSSTVVENKPSLLPTSIPYMVTLHRFFETDNAIYLLLQYASGGRLWDYISGYLHQGRSHVPHNSQIGEDIPDCQNVYRGHKLHGSSGQKAPSDFAPDVGCRREREGDETTCEEDRPEAPTEVVVRYSRHSQLEDVSPLNEGQVDIGLSGGGEAGRESQDGSKSVRDGKGENASAGANAGSGAYVQVGSAVSSGGPDSDAGTPVKSEETEGTQSDQPASTRTKVDFNRYLSISSEDCQPSDMDSLPASLSQPAVLSPDGAGEPFEEVLKSSKPPLENFSINSFESDGHPADNPHPRLSSKNSDLIERIPEDAELAPDSASSSPELPSESSQEKVGDDVFSGAGTEREGTSSSSQTQELPGQGQEVEGDDTFAETISSGDLNADEILRSSRELLQSVDRVLSESDSLEPLEASEIDISSADMSSAPKVDQDSSEEPSIYDIHRASDDSDSNGVRSPTPPSSVLDQLDAVKDGTDAGAGAAIASSELSEASSTKRKAGIPPPLTDLDKTNMLASTEGGSAGAGRRRHLSDLTRSASFEYDLKSPVKNKARALSSFLEQLDAESPEAQRIPESCIKRWAAELVVALAALHAQGIVCRDLKPDNILLGEHGHLILTYICQLRQADHETDWNAIEQLYTAPEVRSIGSCNETCDWWSLGALLYELLVGRTLYQCHPGGINSHSQLHFPSHVSTEAQALLQELLRFSPRERLGAGMDGAEEIKAHPFFSGIDWHVLETS